MSFTRGAQTLTVPMRLFAENRQRLCKALKSENAPDGSFVLLKGGTDLFRYNTDAHDSPFHQESYFHWTFGVQEPDFYGAVDVDKSRSILFMPKLPDSFAVWSGKIHDQKYYQRKYEVDEVHYVEEIASFLQRHNVKKVLLLEGQNTDSGEWIRAPTIDGLKEKIETDVKRLYPVISECRVFKTPLEVEVIRYACKISCDAHTAMMRAVRPGMYEYQLESIFKHHSLYHGGCRHLGYCCIAASGCNGAVLHYGHAGAPNDKQIRDGDLCVFDMGAEYCCYTADVTTTFPANGKFSDDQKLIYNAVLRSNQAVQKSAKPGVSWVDMHLLSQRVILEHLKAGGLLTGDVDEMMKANLGAIFMPHGLGHFMGIDVHDVHGYPPGTERIDKPSLRNLRTTRTLKAGMVITVEPGCYFIDVLLDEALKNPEHSKFLVAPAIARFRNFGGVRIEDDVLITNDGVENLSIVPREIHEIEALMAKARAEG
jgi:Xaa-Pro dipeptidase